MVYRVFAANMAKTDFPGSAAQKDIVAFKAFPVHTARMEKRDQPAKTVEWAQSDLKVQWDSLDLLAKAAKKEHKVRLVLKASRVPMVMLASKVSKGKPVRTVRLELLVVADYLG